MKRFAKEKWGRKLMRLLAALLCAALILAAVPEFTPRAQAAADGMVRVRISKLSTGSSVSLATTCAYYINGNPANTIPSGESFTVTLSEGNLYLTAGGSKRAMGTSFALTRSRSGACGAKGQKPATTNLLCGDLLFSKNSSSIQTVVRLYVEDYLYGVVAYEMSNSYPLEALKAQAVAARNFVLRKKAARTAYAYDVTDGTNDQVYRGYVASYTRVIQAVQETKGVVLYYDGKLASCFYGASNGGQTESTKNAWGSSLPYSVVKDDPYDLESGATSKTATINKDASGLNSALKAALISGMAADLQAKGLSTKAADITIDRIVSITPHSPRFAAPSRLYQKLRFAMNVTGTNAAGKKVQGQVSADVATYGGLESWYSLSINSASNETVSVEETSSAFRVVFRRWGHGVGMSQRGAQVMAKNHGMSAREILAFYYPGTTWQKLSLADTTGSTGNGSGGTVVDDDTREPIGQARVALTTSGATLALRASASATAETLADIPNGALLDVYAVENGWAAVAYNGKQGFVAQQYLTSPDATPAPTPVATLDPNGIYARLQLDDEGSSMHLRSGPSTETESVCILAHGAVLQVLGTSGEWANVRTQAGETGYVKSKYLVAVDATPAPAVTAEPTPEATPTPAPTVTPTAAPDAPVYAQLKLSSGNSMNLRQGPSTSSKVVTVLKNGAVLQVLGVQGEWSQVRNSAGKTGFVKTKYLVKQNAATPAPTAAPSPTEVPTPTAVPTPAATEVPLPTEVPSPTATPTPAATPEASGEVYYARVKLGSSSARMNVRKSTSTSSAIVTTVKHGSYVRVLSTGQNWCAIETQSGKQGFIKRKYLVKVTREEALAGTAAQPAEPAEPAQTEPVGQTEPVAQTDIAAKATGNVYLRQKATKSSKALTTVRKGANVRVLAYSGEWAYIEYGSKKGYIKKKYLKISE